VLNVAAISEIADKKSREDAMSGARLKHYGWGREGEGMTAEEQAFVLGRYHEKFACDEQCPLSAETRKTLAHIEFFSL